MNIKKQIQNLYFYEIISGLQIVDAVWVVFLLQRGFSLAEAGVAEGFFHVVSMCCEIPSGMISDIMGRKKTLALSGILSAMSAACMLSSEHFGILLLAMGLNAVSYNLVSGTREALTYDSLLQVKQEERYLKIASVQETLYLALYAAASLLSVFTVAIGYRKAYGIAVIQGLLCTFFALRLQEAEIKGKTEIERFTGKVLLRELKRHFIQSGQFLLANPLVCRFMLMSGILGAGSYLVQMFLQEHLVECGLKPGFIGIPLLLISLCGMAGALLGEKLKKLKFSLFSLAGGVLAGGFIALSGRGNLFLSVAAAGAVSCLGEAVTLRAESENQRLFSSKIRATMISVSSMVYSIFMVCLSPVTGWAAKRFSIGTAFAGLGAVTVVLMCILVFWKGSKKQGNSGK